MNQHVNEPVTSGGSAAKSTRPVATNDAGETSEGGAAGAANDVPPRDHCVLDDTCVSKCTVPSATCGIEAYGGYCEFAGFEGASTQVACGERKVIGTACCGGCGCVPVEVFFDGEQCWEGAPQCAYPIFASLMFSPHPPTPANAPPFTPSTDVPGTFYLGGGGIAGSDTGSGGSIGFVTGGSGGVGGGEASAGGGGNGSGAAGSANAGEGGEAGQPNAATIDGGS